MVPLFRSIEVEGVKEVYVINNEFNINVIKVQQSPAILDTDKRKKSVKSNGIPSGNIKGLGIPLE